LPESEDNGCRRTSIEDLFKSEHIFEPVLGMVFDSRQEAKEFYNLYSWEVGFGVKYNCSRSTKNGMRHVKNDVNIEENYRSMQEIVCQKSVSQNCLQNNALDILLTNN
jgi:hypothetical protein